MATYYERNKERLLAYQKAYYEAHKERAADYNAHYFQNVTKYVRQSKRKPRAPSYKPKTTIRYNSGTVTKKRIRIRKPKIKEPPPKPEVKILPGMLLDWNNL